MREAKLHGVDWVKIYTTQDFVGDEYSVFKPDGTLVNSPSLTEEEVMAIVDEAHRLGLKVACHTYGGEGQLSCLKAGVDAPNHLTGSRRRVAEVAGGQEAAVRADHRRSRRARSR